MAVRDANGGVGMGGRLRKKIGGGWVSTRQSCVDDFLPSQDAGASRRARRRLHVRRHGVRIEQSSGEKSEWYNVKVRGILGSGKRDVREIEILGRNLTWTEGGLEYEGSVKHRQALLEGLGFERGVEGGQQCSYETGGDQSRRRRRNVGRARNKKVQKFGSDVELHEFGQVGRAIRSEGSVHKNGEPDSRQLEEVEGSRQVSGRSG